MSVTLAPVLRASLADRPVVVQAGQRGEPLLGDVGGVAQRDQRVGVGRVAGHADADVVGGHLVEGLALRGEDRPVGLQQVTALHARAAGTGADQQRQVHAVEDLVRVGADLHPGQQREGAVVEFHHHALERLQRGLDLEQTQLDRAVRAQQRATGQAEQQAVADLAGGTGDGDLEWTCAHVGSAPLTDSFRWIHETGFGVETSAPAQPPIRLVRPAAENVSCCCRKTRTMNHRSAGPHCDRRWTCFLDSTLCPKH